MEQSHTIQPVAPSDRILALDVLRGFAMFGVLVAYCMWNLGTAPEESWSSFDRTFNAVLTFLVDGKFYTILAFLFGLGFSLQLEKASDSAATVRVYCRRLAVLAGIGLIHSLLLRNGDILLPYALTGFLLIPFRRSSDRVLFVAAFVALLVPYLARWITLAASIPIPDRPHLENAPYLLENAAWVRYWYETAIFTWPTNLTLFLFGYFAGRHKVITRLAQDRQALVTILILGPLASLILFFMSSWMVAGDRVSTLDRALAALTYTFHCWAMSSGYAAALMLALRSRVGTAVVSPLASIGRMALTNYIGQSIIVVPLCLAFGWFDTFTPTGAMALALAVFAFQLPFSMWWLKHFQFGPFEWVWRLLTYGRIPPLKSGQSDFAPV